MTPAGLRHHLPDGRTRLLGIVGSPLEHSLSPALHTAVLRRLDRNLIYLPFPVSPERLEGMLREAPGLGLLGLNVTTPLKEAAARLVRPADADTERTGAVNTIQFLPDGPQGCSTDGKGILRWLAEAGLGGLPFGVLGFGPTGRSLVSRALAGGLPVAAVLTSRPGEVERSLRQWGGESVLVLTRENGVRMEESSRPPLWVSTLPPSAPPLPAAFWDPSHRPSVLLDLNYGPGRTPLLQEAKARGCPAADGRGPLCHQAALSLSLWLGEEIPVGLFYRALGSSAGGLRPKH